jgi:Arc/MetJ-type ribon-helix-helix transcriptional regulator
MALHRLPNQEAHAPRPGQAVTESPVWYDSGMTKVAKITVSLPEEQVARVREAVARGEAASVSGYVSAALFDALARPGPEQGKDENALAELVAELIAEHGEPSAEAYAWADAAFALSDPD